MDPACALPTLAPAPGLSVAMLPAQARLKLIRILLNHLHEELPEARLDGYDISAAQYPPEAWLPTKVTLSTLDIFQDVPIELEGQFDVVHLRAFLAVVKNNDPTPILQNLIKLLSAFPSLLTSMLDQLCSTSGFNFLHQRTLLKAFLNSVHTLPIYPRTPYIAEQLVYSASMAILIDR